MLRVMIVDDESNARNGLVHYIDWAEMGCEIVEVASDGIEALEKLALCTPDILISDIRMPGMDGIALSQEIARQYPRIKIVLLSGYSDFEYAQKAIQSGVSDYLLKPIPHKALAETIQRICRELDAEGARLARQQNLESQISTHQKTKGHLVLYQLLNQGPVPAEDFTLAAETLSFGRWGFGLILFEISSPDVLENESLDSMLKNVERVVAVTLQGLRITAIRFGSNSLNVILHLDEEISITKLRSQCEEILEALTSVSEAFATVAISTPRQNYRLLGVARLECDTLLGCLPPELDGGVYYAGDLPDPQAFSISMMSAFYARLIEGAEHGELYNISNTLDSFFADVEKRNIPLAVIRKALAMAGSNLIRLLGNHGMSAGERNALQEAYMQEINSAEDARHLHIVLLALCTDIITRLGKQNDKNLTIARRVQDYIDTHYAQDISLASLAKHPGYVSPAYLSRLFTQVVGTPLSLYINTVRMHHAAQLLMDSSLRIYQVGEQVGIHDPVYFSKLFKKQTGHTPKEYRRLL